MNKIDFEDLVLYEDNDFLIINKPPFISTLNDRISNLNILSMAKKARNDKVQVAHRLDKETSGILTLAKNHESYKILSYQFEKRTVEKKYHALVSGIHNFHEISVNLPILNLSNGTVKISRKGKQATTIFNTVKSFDVHTLLECKPLTGRTHQIRIHLTSIKAPIIGDILYGGKSFYLSSIKKRYNLKKFTQEQPLIKRMALHANSICFKSLSGKSILAEAPYPKDFKVLLKQLEKNTITG